MMRTSPGVLKRSGGLGLLHKEIQPSPSCKLSIFFHQKVKSGLADWNQLKLTEGPDFNGNLRSVLFEIWSLDFVSIFDFSCFPFLKTCNL